MLKQEAAKRSISEGSPHRARHELGFVAETESGFAPNNPLAHHRRGVADIGRLIAPFTF